jgi:hypothetical protein
MNSLNQQSPFQNNFKRAKLQRASKKDQTKYSIHDT